MGDNLNASENEMRRVDAVRGAELGLRLTTLTDERCDRLKRRLTVKTKPWDPNEKPRAVPCWREDGEFLWMPRNYPIVPESVDHHTTTGISARFDTTAIRLDPERQQDQCAPAVIDHLFKWGDGILVSPTGTGKTVLGLYIGAYFGRAIGWPVYASHMEDNVRAHAHLIGLSDDDIGVVRSDRCDLGKPLTIMYVQSLLARRYPDELYQQFGIVVCDEVNRHGAPEWKATLEQFPAVYRLGMSADPRRRDGLDPIVSWLFGDVAFRAKRVVPRDAKPPTVVAFKWGREYSYNSYCRWRRGLDGWESGDPHPTKYDKRLARDAERNRMLMDEVHRALSSGRQILCLSRFVDHLIVCRGILLRLIDPVSFVERLARLEPPPALPQVRMLRQGLNEAQRQEVYGADVIFATFKMASDALNVPSLDTLFFLTPPGDPLQPGGRLRWKAEEYERRALLIGDVYEEGPYPERRYRSRRDKVRGLGMQVREVRRYPQNYR